MIVNSNQIEINLHSLHLPKRTSFLSKKLYKNMNRFVHSYFVRSKIFILLSARNFVDSAALNKGNTELSNFYWSRYPPWVDLRHSKTIEGIMCISFSACLALTLCGLGGSCEESQAKNTRFFSANKGSFLPGCTLGVRKTFDAMWTFENSLVFAWTAVVHCMVTV